MIKKRLFVLVLALFSGALSAHSDDGPSIAQYLANEGLMVTHGDTKVVFDPLFRNSYGHYQLLPRDMEEALFIPFLLVSATSSCSKVERLVLTG